MSTRRCGSCGWLRIIVAGAVGWAVAAHAENVVYLKNGQTTKGTVKWKESTGEYVVVDPEGTIVPIPKAQVDHLEIDKPADFDKAAQMVNAGQVDQGIPLLDAIVTEYKMRVWDNKAREVLALAYLRKNDPKKAVDVMDPLIASVPKAEIEPDTQLLYWRALLGANRAQTLKKELDDTIATGPKELAAAAQIMRGDMNRAQGLKEDALLDYFRTIVLFEAVKAAQPEALFKAAELLDELRDPRAGDVRKKLVGEYPNSEFANKAKAKL